MQNEINTAVSLDDLMSNPALHSLDINSDEFAAAVAETKNEQTDTESATVSEEIDDETKDQDTPETDTEPKKKRGVEKRIDKLVAEKRDLERRLAALETPTPPAQVAQVKSGKPQLDDFDTLEDFTEALTDWKLDQREQKRNEDRQRQETADSWESRASIAKSKFDDFDDYVNANSLHASNASQESLLFLADSELGPQVIYSLLKDDDILDQFAKASPIQQVKILTKVELSLETKKNATPSTTSAPPPPKKLSASTKSTTGRDLIQHAGEMSDAEWLRLADEHSRNKRKR